MRKMKKALAVILAAALASSMSLAAFAAPGDTTGEGGQTTEGGQEAAATISYDHPLTVTGLQEGDVAHFYQIIKWVGAEEEDHVTGWKAVAPFDTVLTKDVLQEVLVGTKKEGESTSTPGGITAALAGEIARTASGNPVDVIVAKGATQAELNNPESGMWMALITPADPDTLYNPVFVAADYNTEDGGTIAVTDKADYSDQAAAKKSTVSLTKTANTEEDEWDDTMEGLQWTTTAIGDTVNYTVDTTIPGYGKVYEEPFFKLTDTLKDLTLKQDTVTLVAPAGLTEGKEYKVTTAADGYSIVFDSAYLKTLTAPTAVQVTYDAIVATDAALHVNPEKNEVWTEFSHDPTKETDHNFKKDTTQHYTFTIDAEGIGGGEKEKGKKTSEIVKIGVDADGNPITSETLDSWITDTEKWSGPLEGAKFKLYTDAEAKNEYFPKDKEGNQSKEPLEVTTNKEGRMTITGLDAGTYYLQESEAPAGFVRDTTIHTIVISATMKTVEVTEYTNDGVKWSTDPAEGEKSYTFETEVLDTYTVQIDGENTATYHFTNKGTDAEIEWEETAPVEKPFDIINTKGTELPSTGGMGTKLFYIVGSILVLGAGIILVARRRMMMQ